MNGIKFRVGVEGAYPPFSWVEKDGTLKGFDIDIAMALCEEIGAECVLVPQDWDGTVSYTHLTLPTICSV